MGTEKVKSILTACAVLLGLILAQVPLAGSATSATVKPGGLYYVKMVIEKKEDLRITHRAEVRVYFYLGNSCFNTWRTEDERDGYWWISEDTAEWVYAGWYDDRTDFGPWYEIGAENATKTITVDEDGIKLVGIPRPAEDYLGKMWLDEEESEELPAGYYPKTAMADIVLNDEINMRTKLIIRDVSAKVKGNLGNLFIEFTVSSDPDQGIIWYRYPIAKIKYGTDYYIDDSADGGVLLSQGAYIDIESQYFVIQQTQKVTVKETGSSNITINLSEPFKIYLKPRSLSIQPSSQEGAPGTTIDYSVIVKNRGDDAATFTLSASDTRGWTLGIDGLTTENETPSIDPDKFWKTTLHARIPADENGGVSNTITVNLSGAASDSDTAEAKVRSPETGFIECEVTVEKAVYPNRLEVGPTSFPDNWAKLDTNKTYSTDNDYFTATNQYGTSISVVIAGGDAKATDGSDYKWTLSSDSTNGEDEYVVWYWDPTTSPVVIPPEGRTVKTSLPSGDSFNFGIKILTPSNVTQEKTVRIRIKVQKM